MKSVRYSATFGLLVLALAAMSLSMVGCSNDDDDTTTTSPVPTLPTSGDAVVAAFETFYSERDIDGYRALLHPNFKFLLDPTAPHTEDCLDYDTDTAIAATMFSGHQGGIPGVIPITAIFIASYPVSDWLPVPEYDSNFGGQQAQWREYTINLLIQRENYGSFMISGPVSYYIVPIETREGGQTREVWQLLGQWDHTGNPGVTEEANWSEVKLLYQPTR